MDLKHFSQIGMTKLLISICTLKREQRLKLNFKGVALSNWIMAVSFNEMEGQRKNTILCDLGHVKKRRQVGKQVHKSGDLRAICARDWHLELISTYTAFKAMKTERVFSRKFTDKGEWAWGVPIPRDQVKEGKYKEGWEKAAGEKKNY